PDIVALVQRLIDRGYAYAVDGEVYFRTRKAKHSFGILSHRKVEDIVVEPMSQAGKKEDPLDFALWKRSKEGEPSWPSAWGPGRPGWHVECNAMAFKYLGAPLDIHGGGLDLVFPHHESEGGVGGDARGDRVGQGRGGSRDRRNGRRVVGEDAIGVPRCHGR